MSFNNIIGHENIKNQIEKSIDLGKFSHAHLIIGEDGIGKSLIARSIGLKLLGKTIDREYADIVEFRVQKNKQTIGIKYVVEEMKLTKSPMKVIERLLLFMRRTE